MSPWSFFRSSDNLDVDGEGEWWVHAEVDHGGTWFSRKRLCASSLFWKVRTYTRFGSRPSLLAPPRLLLKPTLQRQCKHPMHMLRDQPFSFYSVWFYSLVPGQNKKSFKYFLSCFHLKIIKRLWKLKKKKLRLTQPSFTYHNMCFMYLKHFHIQVCEFERGVLISLIHYFSSHGKGGSVKPAVLGLPWWPSDQS